MDWPATLLWIVFAPVLLGICLWTAGALYFDAGSGKRRGGLLVVGWLAFCAGVLLRVRPMWLAALFPLAGSAFVLRWWATQKPSNNRHWDPSFAVLPEFERDGNRITARHIRDTEYRTLEDCDVRLRDYTYRLDSLQNIDLMLLYWGSPLMSHPIIVFEFDEGPRLCFSIEVRYRQGDQYGVVRGLYRQNELMYVVTTERDAILRRTLYSEDQEIYLYRLQMDPEESRAFFVEYMAAANELRTEPRWYNVVTTNCTTTVYRQRNGKMPWDWRILFNGHIDKMLYERGRLTHRFPFSDLRLQSKITEIANAASEVVPDRAFGDWIRQSLPGFTNDQ